MKILYIGNVQGLNNIDKYYLTDKRLTNGFTRLGHNVCLFNDRDHSRYSSFMRSQSTGKTKMNQRLIEACKSFKPDLLMLGSCKNVTNDTLNKIRQIFPQIKMSYTNVDPLHLDATIKYINQRASIVDTIFVTTAGRALKQFNQGKTQTYFFPNPVDPAIDTQQAFNNEKANIDVLFLGNAFRQNNSHDEREDYAKHLMNNLPHDRIKSHIGGMGVNQNHVFGDDYLDLLGRTKIGICINKTTDFYLYASDRMSHYMGAGVLVFLQEGPNFESILGNNSFVSFSDQDDLIEKIQYYSEHTNEAKKIAKNGHKKAHDLFNVDKICQFILDMTFNGKTTQSFIWHKNDLEDQNK